MSSVDKLVKLADRFARKLSLAQAPGQVTNQPLEAPDFFFGPGRALKAFTDSLGHLSMNGQVPVGNQSLAKLMADYFNKHQDNVSVTISVEVVPGKGARWVADISPPAFVQPAMAELNKQYQAATGMGWVAGQAAAAKLAKSGQALEGDGKRQIFDMGL